MKASSVKRLICGIAILCSIIWGYWWLTLLFVVLFTFFFPMYFEIIVAGILYDSLYGLHLNEFWNIRFIFTIASIILFTISVIIRKYLMTYET